MSGNLPPGCTQDDCDRAQPGYWDAPQEWFQCDACNGSGEEVHGVWGYEPGCGHRHMMEIGEPCGKCNGAGGWLDDATPDNTSDCPYRHFTDEEEAAWEAIFR